MSSRLADLLSVGESSGTRTRLVAATVVSLMGAGWEQLGAGWDQVGAEDAEGGARGAGRRSGAGGAGRSGAGGESGAGGAGASETDDDDSFWNDSPAGSEGRGTHFIDVLLDKLLVHAMPGSLDDTRLLQQRLDDPLNEHAPPLSLAVLSRNVRQLVVRLTALFRLQFQIVKVFRWTNPPLTVCCLILYSLVVLHPVLLLLLPLALLFYHAMVPGFLHRHPIDRPDLFKVKKRSESLIERLLMPQPAKKTSRQVDQDIRDHENVYDVYQQVYNDNQGDSSRATNNTGNEFTKDATDTKDSTTTTGENVEFEVNNDADINEKIDANVKMLKRNIEFVMNMRDLQNSLGNIIKILNSFEKFWYGSAGFKDERHSTSLFFTLFISMFSLLLVKNFIPWKCLFLVLGWVLLLMLHPSIKPHLKTIKQAFKAPKEEINKIVKDNERKDIMIDEPPEIKQVEIFEIWKKSQIDPNLYEFFLFANTPFDCNDYYRKSQTPPPGVHSLDAILPPKSWKFEVNSWIIDYNCNDWCEQRGIDVTLGDVSIDSQNEFLIDAEFKRRRLFRNVLRYSRPARKPPHMS